MSGYDAGDMRVVQERAKMYLEDIKDELAEYKKYYGSPEVQAMLKEHPVYKEYYEADQNWRKASAIGSNNENYLQAAERLKAAREAVRKLWGE